MNETVQVRELSAWGFDDFPYRPASHQARSADHPIAPRQTTVSTNPVLPDLTQSLAELLAPHAGRPDLHAEMAGLTWSLGIVDLRLLQAFQRRLSLSRHHCTRAVPMQDDWPALIDLAFAPPRPIHYQLEPSPGSGTFILTTCDPNLHLRPSANPATPLVLHGGSPFFEVALYRGRWFLRDGYHRAFALLERGVFAMPAVILTANTLADLGANGPRFFPECVLLSSAPPFVHHFLEDHLTIDYQRPVLRKTLRLTVEETFAPAAGEPA